jgi:4-hydroxy-tetrahydrodipicolinate synthase
MTALITPFKNGKIDEESYISLIQRQIKLGIDWVVPVGTTGESATLTHEEHRRCIEIAVATTKNTKVKVLAGAGSNSTMEAINLVKFAEKIGANGVLSVAPYYNKPTQEGLFQHYKGIANSVNIPVMLYNVPSRTGVDILPETVKRLSQFKNIVAIKEATGSLNRSFQLIRENPNLDIISGDDSLNSAIIEIGGQGVISVTSNLLPNKIIEIIAKSKQKDFYGASKINDYLMPLNQGLFLESNPIPIKAIMYLAGLIPNLEYRLPLTSPSSATMKELEKLYTYYNNKGDILK